jgi:hypothetical protein
MENLHNDILADATVFAVSGYPIMPGRSVILLTDLTDEVDNYPPVRMHLLEIEFVGNNQNLYGKVSCGTEEKYGKITLKKGYQNVEDGSPVGELKIFDKVEPGKASCGCVHYAEDGTPCIHDLWLAALQH